MSKRVLITFGMGPFSKRRFVLAKQAKMTKLFNTILAYGKEDFGPEFQKHREFIDESSLNPRQRHGYWLWKPYFIQKTLRELDEGDILMYIDSGCNINLKQISALRLLLEIIEGAPEHICGIAFLVELNHPLKEWTKKDILIRFKTVDIELPQIAGGYLIIRNSKATRDLINNWYQLCCSDSYSLLDDSPSKSGDESAYFKGNKHDQSILTMCIYDSGKFVILPSELTTTKKIAPFYPSRKKDENEAIVGRIKWRLKWGKRNIERLLS